MQRFCFTHRKRVTDFISVTLFSLNVYVIFNQEQCVMRWYSKTGTQYRDKLFYIRGVSDEKTV
ncbi:hypothetical protein CN555_06315 [Bacillus wiedmannii]|nr:hypothetical protein CN555_06315 [Bacillus wiedmannii]